MNYLKTRKSFQGQSVPSQPKWLRVTWHKFQGIAWVSERVPYIFSEKSTFFFFTFTQYVQANVQESPTRGRASQCWRQCTSVDLQNYSKTTSFHSVKFHKANLAENCFLQTFANSSQTSGIVWKIFNFDSSWRYFLHLNTLKYFQLGIYLHK